MPPNSRLGAGSDIFIVLPPWFSEVMKLLDMIATHRERLALVDTSSAAFKAGVVLRTIWELSKPIIFITVLFFAIGTYFLFSFIIKAALGYKT